MNIRSLSEPLSPCHPNRLTPVIIFTYIFVTACASTHPKEPFHFQKCMDTIPDRVKELKILSGPRTKQSIIHDMVPIVCRGQALFYEMTSKEEGINPGRDVFRVQVEWTGEVYSAIAVKNTTGSKKFARTVSDFIMNSDFVAWSRDDTDSFFLYPVDFGN